MASPLLGRDQHGQPGSPAHDADVRLVGGELARRVHHVGGDDGGHDASNRHADGVGLCHPEPQPRRSGQDGRLRRGLSCLWTAFAAGATAAQWTLQARDLLSPTIVSVSPVLSAALLVIAGAFQFTPVKRACLRACRSPLGFLLTEWRNGLGGAAQMGVRHGLYCLGCCWALMALLFVGGAMNLLWIAALTLLVAMEKLAPKGEILARVLGALMIVAGAVRLIWRAS